MILYREDKWSSRRVWPFLSQNGLPMREDQVSRFYQERKDTACVYR
jgi:hypothetical protein